MRWWMAAAPLVLGACHAVIGVDDYEAVAIVGEWRSVDQFAGNTADMVFAGDGEGSGSIPIVLPMQMTILTLGVELRWERTDDEDIFAIEIRCADAACAPSDSEELATMLCEAQAEGQELLCVIISPEQGEPFTLRRQ